MGVWLFVCMHVYIKLCTSDMYVCLVCVGVYDCMSVCSCVIVFVFSVVCRRAATVTGQVRRESRW